MDELIDYLKNFFASFITQSKEKVNAAIKTLPPIEQNAAASEASFALRGINGCAQELMSSMTHFEERIKGVLAEASKGEGDLASKLKMMTAQAAEKFLQEKITAGEIVKKSDMEAAIENTRTQAVNAERESAKQAVEREQLIGTRRTELVAEATKDGIAKEVIGAVSAELLGGDDYKTKTGVVIKRIKDFSALGITSAEVLTDVVGIPVTQEGDTEFKRRLDLQKKIADDLRKTAPTGGKRAPFVPAGAANAQKGDNTNVLCI